MNDTPESRARHLNVTLQYIQNLCTSPEVYIQALLALTEHEEFCKSHYGDTFGFKCLFYRDNDVLVKEGIFQPGYVLSMTYGRAQGNDIHEPIQHCYFLKTTPQGLFCSFQSIPEPKKNSPYVK